MAFFNVFGNAGRGAHSDIHTDGLKRPLRTTASDPPSHGPVRVLMEDGQRLKVPKVIPVRKELRA